MKRTLKWMILIIVFIIVLSGCQIRKNEDLDFSIRMTIEQISQGSFTGGRLIFSENGINHLEKGTLIPILDMIQGFVPGGDGEGFEFKRFEENYGYYYVVESNPEFLILDYLLYDSNGKIIDHEERITVTEGKLLNVRGEEISHDSVNDFHYKLSYSNFSARDTHYSRELQGASLLSFPNEVPTEEAQMSIDTEKRYRTVLFRLQETGNQPYEYTSGVIAAHESEPFLIIDSSYYDETNSTDSLVGINDPDLPEIEVGDYILDHSASSARRVTQIIPGNDTEDTQTFDTDVIHLQEAVGAMIIQVEGDLGEIIQRYGSQAEKKRLNELLSRKHYDVWEAQGKANLWKGEDSVQLELDYNTKLGINLDFKFVVTWHEVSGKGDFSVETKNGFGFFFKLDGHTADTEKKGTFFSIPLEISVEKFKIGIDFDIVADYEIEENNKSIYYYLNMQTGPCELGMYFDLGGKLAFKWGWLPYLTTWNKTHVIKNGFNKGSALFDAPHLKQLEDNKINMGIDAKFDFNIFKALIFNLDANIGISNSIVQRTQEGYDWWADIGSYGSLDHLKFGIGLPFSNIGHIWDFGTIWKQDPDSEEGRITSIPLDDIMDP